MLPSVRTLSFCSTLLVGLAAMQSTQSSAAVLVTSNPTQVAQFQSGATVEDFDNLPGLGITSYDNGQVVPTANQFSSRNTITFTSPFFNSGGASFNDPVGNSGTPIGIFQPQGATIGGDVKSLNNVAGPLIAIGGPPPTSFEAFTNGFMEVIFPADVRRVGFWVTHGTVTLFLKDATNTNLSTGDVQVTGNAGEFIAIQRDTADVRGVTIGFPQAFTIDDFTYSSAAAVPEPSRWLMTAMGLIALVGAWRVRNARGDCPRSRGACSQT